MKPAVSAGCDNEEKMMRRAKRKKAFTLVETMLASVIMCGAVLALGSISTRCLSETRMNRHREVASMLLDRQFSMIDFMGIDEFIEADNMSGIFEEYEQGYQWRAVTQVQDTDNLYLVQLTVSWSERRGIQSVSVDTMFNGQGMAADTIETGEAGEENREGG